MFVLGSPEDGGPGSMDATTGAEGGGGDAGRSDSGGSDGGGGASDAEAKDAEGKPTDAGDAETPPVDSGGSGASDAGFACPSSDPTVIFCSGFDTEDMPPWEWSGAPVNAKGVQGVDKTDFLSPPNGFSASNLALENGDTYTLAYVGKSPLSSLLPRIDYSFHAYVKEYNVTDAMAPAPDVLVAQIVVGGASASTSPFSMEIVLSAGTLRLDQVFQGSDGGPQTMSTTIGPLVTGKWGAVEMLLDRSTTMPNWSLTIYLDGVEKLELVTAQSPPVASFEVDLGIVGVLPPSGANSITFDNVVVRAY